MTEDYLIYVENKEDISNLVFKVYNKYKPMIERNAKKFAYYSGGRIDKEDFQSDVYEKLYYFMKYINVNKINPEKFMFHIYIKHSISKVLSNSKKVNTNEYLNIDDEEYENVYVAKETFSPVALDLDKFYSKLSDRQIVVLRDRQNGIHEEITRKKLGISHGTYQGCIDRARELANDYF